MKSKRIKTKETDTKKVTSDVNAVDPSRLTVHDSRFTVFITTHVSRLTVFCLVFLIVIIYANTLNAPFQWDESDFIVNNPIIKNLHYFSTPSDASGFKLYSSFIGRYIGFLTFALNYRINGLSVTGYHIVNIAIHIANSILVYFLVLLTFRTPYFRDWGPGIGGQESKAVNRGLLVPGPWSLVPFFSAAIFAVHPLQTEAVTYVFQRFASLVAFFYLLSLVFYIKARLAFVKNSVKNRDSDHFLTSEDNKKWSLSLFFQSMTKHQSLVPGSRFLRSLWLILSFLSAVLAMKTKENAFTLPFVITLYEFCFFSHTPHPSLPLKGGGLGRGFTSLVSRFIFLVPFLLTLLIIPLTLMSLTGSHQLDPGSYGTKVFPRDEYFFTQFRVIVKYLRLLLFPVNQNAAYYDPLFKSFFDPQVILSFLFLTALFGLGVYLVKQAKVEGKVQPVFRLIGFGILWFFITLSVESSIIPLPMLVDEYRVYLPSVGLIISAVTGVFWVLSRLTPRDSRPLVSRSLFVFLVLIISVLSVTAYLRNEVWGDRIRLWEDIVKKSPGNVRAHNNLGFMYIQKKLYDKAINELNIVIALSPYYADAHYNLGLVYQARNMFDKAIDEYLIAINLNPGLAEAHNNLAVCYQSIKMFDKAIEQYLIAISLKPEYADAHNNLGVIYLALNRPDKALNELQIGVTLMPTDAKAHFFLANVYMALNRPDKALDEYLSAVSLRPDYVEAHNNLAGIYQAFNMLDKAVNEIQTVIKLKPDYAEAHFNLGSLYYRMGQMENAREELMAGLKIKPDDPQAQQLLKSVNR